MSVQAPQENLPERVGRYDVLFRLETGAEANILVARGPEPSAAPVTIKRIARAVTQGKDIGALLARAEETLAVSHPNVVAIRHLLNEHGAICVVTDYLDGETLATLLRRLVIEGKSLAFGLAAYVVAEAAAGISAGHAARLLHERLTPNDILVGHNGTVKVFDVGVAHALADVTGPQTIAEGELSYASPERCKGDPVDHRSDVYSLGIVLWELIMGVSPFERDGQASTLRAILGEDPRLPTTNVMRRLPSELSEIALRAIDRAPANRYPTASALREALISFGRAVPMGGAQPSAALAILMQNIFAKRIRSNARRLRRTDSSRNLGVTPPSDAEARSPSGPSALQAVTVDAFRPVPVPAPAPAAPSEPPPPARRAPAPTPSAAEPPPPEPLQVEARGDLGEVALEPRAPENVIAGADAERETTSFADEPVEAPVVLPGVSTVRWLVPALLGGVAVVLGLSWLLFSGASGGPSPATVASTQPRRDARPVASTAAIPPPAPPPSAADAMLHIDTIPPKATILLDGVSVGVSPMDLKVPRSDKAVIVELRRPGYEPLRESIVPDVDQKLRLSLQPSAHGASPTPAAAPKPMTTTSASATPYRRFD